MYNNLFGRIFNFRKTINISESVKLNIGKNGINSIVVSDPGSPLSITTSKNGKRRMRFKKDGFCFYKDLE